MFSDQKVILAGNTLHYFKYSKPIEYDYQKKENQTYSRRKAEDRLSETQAGFNSNAYRARKAVQYLLQANAWEWLAESSPFRPVFITYTFAECVTSLQQANRDYGKFTKRLNYQVYGYKCSELKYLVVPEFQKRGAVHYHSVYFNLPYVEKIYDFIGSVWGLGFSNVQAVDNIEHLTNYVSKYFSKQSSDHRFYGEKKYFTSRGLHKPREYRTPAVIETLLSSCEEPTYSKEFKSDYRTTQYQCYTIPKKLKTSSLLPQLQYSPVLP